MSHNPQTVLGVIKLTTSKQYSFLAACLAGSQPGQECVQSAFSNPDALFALAATQAVLPAVYARMDALDLLGQVPSALSDPLSAVTELNRERNAFIVSEARTVAALLNEIGIEPTALKGLAYLVVGIYSDSAERYLIDLDFLIPQFQISAAIEALAAAGYCADSSDRVAVFRHHAPHMARPDSLPIELHHSVGLGVPSHILPSTEMITASFPVFWNGVHVRIPSPDHLVTHLILHSQIRHPYSERIWPPLRAMYDLLLLNSRFAASLDWPAIESRFRSAGEHTTFKLHLLQVEKTLGMPRPVPITLMRFEKLRWFRRCLLHRWPALRFFDPTYLFLATLSRRFRLLQSILATPGGWKSALQMFGSLAFYRRLLDEIL